MVDKNQDKASDEELFNLYKSTGDEHYFRSLYDRYARKLYAYCLRAAKDTETAQDIFQKTWTSVIDNKDKFKDGSFIAWMMVIARNFCLMEKRTDKITTEITENILTTNPEDNTDFSVREILKKEINKLPDDLAEIIKLRYFDEFSYKEIADMLQINLSLVKVRLFRAKKILSGALAYLKEF
jgi:RNA polymerase sigma-70 factor (ECF subfamily)